MPDLLTHVLIGYVVGTLLAFRYEWMRPAHVTLVMIGALSPDFVKVKLLVPDSIVATATGVPFSWSPLHTLGGSAVVILLGSLLVSPENRMRAIGLFGIGALTHHALDFNLLTPTGYAYPVLWPLVQSHLPAPNLYLSSDRWPALVAGLAAALVWVVSQRRAAARQR
ncbi:metal-dependent hydrolase [Natribaculum luteum]|uniref:Metal-dependent hydrolase n=1 Tax=Natribaculum luteum TaxID=1586232 RepID=A0ABD5P091_9EURY|nr:metal-dependent hydrolase [Natribaculum luteum]